MSRDVVRTDEGAVRLVLASASAGRLATLRRAGVEPLVVVSQIEEDAVLADARRRYGDLTPADAALLLARAKCEDVAARLEGADPPEQPEAQLVLGCDSLFELDGTAHGKPTGPDDARERWRRMANRTGLLHTGHWLIDLRDPAAGGTGATLGETVSTEVTFAAVTEAEIAAYVATGEPLGCAGAFTIDGYGGAFVTGIVGDPHNVVGLSLPALRTILAALNLPWPALWRPGVQPST